MKRLSILTLLAGTVTFGLAFAPTQASAHPKFTCCNPKECLTLVVVQYPGASDMLRVTAQGRCMQCRYPYHHRNHHHGGDSDD
jgi:hypothetical protein